MYLFTLTLKMAGVEGFEPSMQESGRENWI